MTYEDEPFHAGGGHGCDLGGQVGPAVRVGQGARRLVRRHVTVELELEWQLHLSGRCKSDVTQIPSPYCRGRARARRAAWSLLSSG